MCIVACSCLQQLGMAHDWSGNRQRFSSKANNTHCWWKGEQKLRNCNRAASCSVEMLDLKICGTKYHINSTVQSEALIDKISRTPSPALSCAPLTYSLEVRTALYFGDQQKNRGLYYCLTQQHDNHISTGKRQIDDNNQQLSHTMRQLPPTVYAHHMHGNHIKICMVHVKWWYFIVSVSSL